MIPFGERRDSTLVQKNITAIPREICHHVAVFPILGRLPAPAISCSKELNGFAWIPWPHQLCMRAAKASSRFILSVAKAAAGAVATANGCHGRSYGSGDQRLYCASGSIHEGTKCLQRVMQFACCLAARSLASRPASIDSCI